MKTNKIQHNKRKGVLIATGVALTGILLLALFVGFEKLRDLWLEQCLVRDMDRQVTIHAGKMVKSEVIAEKFGLQTGANLALIDYQAKRAETLASIPNLRDIRIRRHLPDRVTIDIEERVPVARIGLRGQKKDAGKVVDMDGVVFRYFRNTQLLPIIRENSAPGTAIGKRVPARILSALQFIDVSHNPEFQDIGILDIDTASPDYLFATINTGSNYARLKLAWEGMDTISPASRASLTRQLTHLKQAIFSRIGSNAVLWNATEPGRIYADTKGKL